MLYKTLKIEQLKPHNKSRGAGLNSSWYSICVRGITNFGYKSNLVGSQSRATDLIPDDVYSIP